MRAAAAAEGIDLFPVSTFRDFEAQLRIWNEKFRGRRPLYDRGGELLDYSTLNEPEIVSAILCWSAVPGASRHHWGTDIDVIDKASLPPGHASGLIPAEYGPGGPFEKLTGWLNANMPRFGFFRPYTVDRGGVSPEPWHLSYAPVSVPALEQLTESLLRTALLESEIEGKELVVQRLAEIHRRYVTSVDSFV